MGSIVGTIPIFSLALEPLGVFSGPLTGYQNVGLKQIEYRYFSSKVGFTWDQQKIAGLGLQPW